MLGWAGDGVNGQVVAAGRLSHLPGGVALLPHHIQAHTTGGVGAILLARHPPHGGDDLDQVVHANPWTAHLGGAMARKHATTATTTTTTDPAEEIR